MCLIKMPLITSPLLSRLPIPLPPTILIPRDLPGSLKSSTLWKASILPCSIFPNFHFKAVAFVLIRYLLKIILEAWMYTHFLGWFQLLYEALSSPSPSSRSGRLGISLKIPLRREKKWFQAQGNKRLRDFQGRYWCSCVQNLLFSGSREKQVNTALSKLTKTEKIIIFLSVRWRKNCSDKCERCARSLNICDTKSSTFKQAS